MVLNPVTLPWEQSHVVFQGLQIQEDRESSSLKYRFQKNQLLIRMKEHCSFSSELLTVKEKIIGKISTNKVFPRCHSKIVVFCRLLSIRDNFSCDQPHELPLRVLPAPIPSPILALFPHSFFQVYHLYFLTLSCNGLGSVLVQRLWQVNTSKSWRLSKSSSAYLLAEVPVIPIQLNQCWRTSAWKSI